MKRALLILFTARSAVAAVSAPDAADAIVGEAAGQPYAVKLAVGEAIHNRGTLRGVYGYHAAHNQFEPSWVWRDARRAWTESAKTNLVKGATHFGSAADVAKGTFKGMKLMVVVGTGRHATYFFRS